MLIASERCHDAMRDAPKDDICLLRYAFMPHFVVRAIHILLRRCARDNCAVSAAYAVYTIEMIRARLLFAV